MRRTYEWIWTNKFNLILCLVFVYCKMLSYHKETVLQGALVLAKMEDGTGRQYYTDIIGIFSTIVT